MKQDLLGPRLEWIELNIGQTSIHINSAEKFMIKKLMVMMMIKFGWMFGSIHKSWGHVFTHIYWPAHPGKNPRGATGKHGSARVPTVFILQT